MNFSGETPDIRTVCDLRCDTVCDFVYVCWQHERTSHDHIQGYCQMRKECTIKQIKCLFEPYKPHLEKQRARCNGDARDYCLKEDSRVAGPWEWGEFIKNGSHVRKWNELYVVDPETMKMENPSLYRRVKAKKTMEEYCRNKSKLPEKLKSWQKELNRRIEETADDRKIIWVYGNIGGEGKTTYARELLRQGWFYTRGGSIDNVCHQYVDDISRNVVFDIPRDKKEFLQYSLVEMLKDRIVISNKYEPVTMCSDVNVHVVVMSNFLPDFDKISENRLVIIPCIPCGYCLKHHWGLCR